MRSTAQTRAGGEPVRRVRGGARRGERAGEHEALAANPFDVHIQTTKRKETLQGKDARENASGRQSARTAYHQDKHGQRLRCLPLEVLHGHLRAPMMRPSGRVKENKQQYTRGQVVMTEVEARNQELQRQGGGGTCISPHHHTYAHKCKHLKRGDQRVNDSALCAVRYPQPRHALSSQQPVHFTKRPTHTTCDRLGCKQSARGHSGSHTCLAGAEPRERWRADGRPSN